MAFPGNPCKRYQCCKCCKDQCNNDFKKVLNLKDSGLSVYIHHKCKEKRPLSEEKYDAIVVFNTTDKHYKQSTFLSEIGQHNVECFKCRNIIQRVRNLLTEIKCIKGNQTIGVCDYCKQANISNCKRCEYIVSKFMTSNSDAQEAIIHYLITWVRKVMVSLQFSVEEGINKFNLNIRDNCVEELQRLLNDLESPLSKRQPDYYKNLMNKVMTLLQSILEGFLDKYKLDARDASVGELQRLLIEIKALTTQATSMRQPEIERFPIIEEIKSLDNLKVMELLEKLVSRSTKESEISSNKSTTSDKSTTTANNLLTDAKDSTHIIKKTSFDNNSFEGSKNSEIRTLIHEIKKSKDNKKKVMGNKNIIIGNENIPKGDKNIPKGNKNIPMGNKNIPMGNKIIPMGNKLEKSKDIRDIKTKKGKDLSKQGPRNKIKEENITIKPKVSKAKGKNIDDKIDVKLLNKKYKKMKANDKDTDESGVEKDKVSYKDKKKEERDKGIKENEVKVRITNITKTEGEKILEIQHKKNKPLPNIKVKSMLDVPIHTNLELLDASSSSVIECEDTRVVPNVMIKRQHIIPLNPHYGKQDGSISPVQYQVLNSISDTLLGLKLKTKEQSIGPGDTNSAELRSDSPERRHKRQKEQSYEVPLLYHVHKNISSHSLSDAPFAADVNVNSLPTVTKKNKSFIYKLLETNNKGVIKYQLSNPEYITKGWTQLPSLRIMRRINIYKMEPVKTANNWFERNKSSTVSYNGSNETFADIDELGYGKLYYKNGRVALDYYKAEEPNVKYRYVIYSDGEPKNGVPSPVTILGVFDGAGCGVVYDNHGRERLKYNQSEGKVIDKTINSPCKWKWHTLNDPAVLQTVFFDTFSKDARTSTHVESENTSNNTPDKNTEMLAVELENLMKEKADKLLQKFKPLEIRSKTLKLNQQFSLQILHQTIIYLVFREGLTSVKLNLGLMLISDEIVSTETQNMDDLFTPYDQLPPRSKSVENIQKILGSARTSKKKKNSLS